MSSVQRLTNARLNYDQFGLITVRVGVVVGVEWVVVVGGLMVEAVERFMELPL